MQQNEKLSIRFWKRLSGTQGRRRRPEQLVITATNFPAEIDRRTFEERNSFNFINTKMPMPFVVQNILLNKPWQTI